MAYVPIIVAQSQPSARTRELSKAIVHLIGEYRKNEPKTTDVEVQGALQLATAELKAGSGRGANTQLTRIIMLIIGLSVLLLGLGLALWVSGFVG